MPVPVYRWAPPEDIEPLENAIRSIIAGRFDVLMFTSANQVSSVIDTAEQLGMHREWLDAAGRCRIASIGPTCSEAIRACGLHVNYEASPPKMGQLVRGALGVAENDASPG